jgi:hypothetical protein
METKSRASDAIEMIQSLGASEEHAIAFLIAHLGRNTKRPDIVFDFIFGTRSFESLAFDLNDEFNRNQHALKIFSDLNDDVQVFTHRRKM